MERLHDNSHCLRAALGLVIAIGLGASRTEKLWAEEFAGWNFTPIHCSLPQDGGMPFDPRRVPQSGGMAARLLSGPGVKHPATC